MTCRGNRRVAVKQWTLGVLGIGLSLCLGCSAHADSIAINVVDRDQQPLPGVLVSLHGPGLPQPQPELMVLSQEGRRFIPQVLAITVGSDVDFLNKDGITHHVYSFSRPWRQQFRLSDDENQVHTFSTPGRVVLGCNIHDWMLGYIYVMETPVFGFTDESGNFERDQIPAGTYTLRIEHPRLRDGRGKIERELVVAEGGVGQLSIELQKALLPKRDQIPREDYR